MAGLVHTGGCQCGAVRFRVTGMYGPLKAGEWERARAWGAKLARVMQP